MKIADVKIGETYLTKVSGALVRVVAVQRIEPDGRWNKQARFRVRRVDNGRTLDKSRTASALRPLPAPLLAPDPTTERLRAGAQSARALDAEGRYAEAVLAWEILAKDAADANRPKTAAGFYTLAAMARARVALASADSEGAK